MLHDVSSVYTSRLLNPGELKMALRARKVSGAFEKRAPGARFSRVPETFRARKAVFSSSVSKNGEMYTPETSCMKRTSVHIKNM